MNPASYGEILRRESLPAGEVQRYEAQYRFIQQICALYEEEPNDFGKLFTLIQEVSPASCTSGAHGRGSECRKAAIQECPVLLQND